MVQKRRVRGELRGIFRFKLRNTPSEETAHRNTATMMQEKRAAEVGEAELQLH